jgi:Flp pilus assembly protein TadG
VSLARLVARARRVIAYDDRGAAIAEFVMIGALLVFLLFAVLQVAIYFYVRNIVAASASDGARYAASDGVDYGDGGARASLLVRQGLTAAVARDVPCSGSGGVDAASGLLVAAVRCSGKVHSVFLPIGALLSIDVTSRALKEGAP